MIRMICGACRVGTEIKRASDGPFSLSPAEEERLVRLGVAAYTAGGVTVGVATPPAPGSDAGAGVNTDDETPPAGGQETPKSDDEQKKAHLDREQLAGMEYNDLKKLAADMGVNPASKKKDDIIEAIVAATVKPGPEVEPPAQDDDETPPHVIPEEPVT